MNQDPLGKPEAPRVPRLQPKKKGLTVPEGIKFLYVGAPWGKTKKGVPQHQGVVTVAWVESSPGTIVMGFSFCSPADPWCKTTGREISMKRLYEHPLVIPSLYSPKRTAYEVARAIISHDFGRLAALSPGATMWERVPSWTRTLSKWLPLLAASDRLDRKMKAILKTASGFPIDLARNQRRDNPHPTSAQILAGMMRDIGKLGND